MTAAGYALAGARASYYTIGTITVNKASIIPKTLTIAGTVSDKIYDGTSAASFSGAPALSGVLSGDTVILTGGTPAFAGKDAGDDITVNYSPFSVSGADAGNYSVTQPSPSTASILKRTLTVTVNPISIQRGQSVNSHITVSVTGFVNGEDSGLAGFEAPAAAASAHEDTMTAGTRSISVTYSGGAPTGNYQFDTSNTTALLTVRSVAVGSGDYTVTGTAGSWSESQPPSAWSASDLTVAPAGDYDEISADGSDWKSCLTVSNEAANGAVTFYLKAADGTTTDSKTIHYNLDKTAPASPAVTFTTNPVKRILNVISFGLFFNDTVDAALSSTDNLSGIKQYEYQLVRDGDTYNVSGTWQTCSGAFSIDPQFKGTIYARAADQAGNITGAAQSDKFVTDHDTPSAPDIAAAADGNAYDGSAWTTGDVKLAVSGSTALSGIDYYEYSMDNGGTWAAMPVQSGAADATSGQTIADTWTIASDMNVTVLVRAVSNSGIHGNESSIAVKRDAVTPVLHVDVAGVTGQWTNTPVAFTLTDTAGNLAPVTYCVSGGSGVWTPLSGNSVTVSGNADASYRFKAVSASGLESAVSAAYTVRLDTDSPTISRVTGNPADWTNSDAALTVNASDSGGSGMKEYSFDGGQTWQESPGRTYSSNRTVASGTIKVRDNAGNVTSYDTAIAITKIDKAAPASPTVTITTNPVKRFLNAISFGLFFNDTVDVDLSSTDDLSGVKQYEYQLVDDGDAYGADGTWQTCSGTFSINPQFKGTIYARAADHAGNVSNPAQSDKFVTDRDMPTAPDIAATVDGNAYDGSAWTTGDVKLAASGSTALSGIDYYEYSTDNGGTWAAMPVQSGAADATSGQTVADTWTIATDRNVTVLIRAVSNSGVEGRTASVSVKRDAAAPAFAVGVTGAVGQWTAGPVTFVLTGTGGNLSPVTYSVQIGTADWAALAGNSYTFSQSIHQTCRFKAVSAAGNETASTGYAVMIDANSPALSVTGNPADWTNQNITLSVDAQCSPYGVQSVTVSKDGGAAMDITGQNTYTVSENGSYVFTAANWANTMVSETVNVTRIDKTSPVGMTVKVHQNAFTAFLNQITFGLFFRNNVDITLSASDGQSGVDYYEYQLVDTGSGQSYDANGTWVKSASGVFSVSPQFRGLVYACAADGAGNVSPVVSSNGFVTDGQTPTAPTVTAAVNGAGYNSTWTSGNVRLTASGATALSGIDRYEYKIGNSGGWTLMPDQSGATDGTTGNILADRLTISSDMEKDIHIRAVSNPGVLGAESVIRVKRDAVAPSLKVSVSGITGQWTENPVTFTLSDKADNLSPVAYWVKAGSGDWLPLSGDIYEVTANTNTTYQFKAVSDAGLTSSVSGIYTVKLASDVPESFIKNIDSLPDPGSASDKDITGNAQAIKDAKILYDTLSTDERPGVGESRIDKLGKLISRLNTLLVVVPKDPGTGIIAGNIGTSVTMRELNHPNVGEVVVKLVVAPVSSASSSNTNLLIASSGLEGSGKSLVAAYDISLFKTVFDLAGNQISYEKIGGSSITGPVMIRIPVPESYQGRTDLQVAYIDDSGKATSFETTLVGEDGVQYLQFTTTHFSVYAVLAPEKASNPTTGEGDGSLPAVFSVLFGLTAFSIVLWKTRKNRRNI